MPIFEYQCAKCGHVCDALQKLSEAPLRDCPECGKPALKKLLSTPAFHVKGKGSSTAARTRVGHNLDGGATHSHDGHSHSHGDHSHSHSGGHSHGPGKCGCH